MCSSSLTEFLRIICNTDVILISESNLTHILYNLKEEMKRPDVQGGSTSYQSDFPISCRNSIQKKLQNVSELLLLLNKKKTKPKKSIKRYFNERTDHKQEFLC